MEILLSIALGLGLSAATGFRLFIPALIASIASRYGEINLAANMEWLGSTPALVVLVVASVAELGAYYIPFIDNLLDTIATPTAAVCGTLVMGGVLGDVHPVFQWTLAAIAGGGVAGSVKAGNSLIRLKSSALSGGVANPIFATLETAISGILSILSILLPIAAFVVIIYLIFLIVKRRRKNKG